MAGEHEGHDHRARMRISDADRHRVAELLREAAGDGRLDLDELDERLEATWAAKTYADLVPITADLPGATTQPADAGASAAADTSSTNLSAPTVNVGVDGKVEQFSAQDLDITTALHFLSLQSKRNIIASKEVRGNVTANLYDVTFSEALDALLKPNGFDYIEKGNFI